MRAVALPVVSILARLAASQNAELSSRPPLTASISSCDRWHPPLSCASISKRPPCAAKRIVCVAIQRGDDNLVGCVCLHACLERSSGSAQSLRSKPVERTCSMRPCGSRGTATQARAWRHAWGQAPGSAGCYSGRCRCRRRFLVRAKQMPLRLRSRMRSPFPSLASPVPPSLQPPPSCAPAAQVSKTLGDKNK